MFKEIQNLQSIAERRELITLWLWTASIYIEQSQNYDQINFQRIENLSNHIQ